MSNCPAGGTADLAQSALIIKSVYLIDNPVNIIIKLWALFCNIVIMRQKLICCMAEAGEGVNLKAIAHQCC